MECARQSEFGASEVNGAAAGDLLAALRDAHADLLVEMANMDLITQGRTANSLAYASGRWKISQASLRRRQLAAVARHSLLAAGTDADRAAVRPLEDAEQQMMRRSREHVGSWTIARIDRDWDGYCDASRLIRWHMDAHLLLERKTLFPLLERAARRANSVHSG